MADSSDDDITYMPQEGIEGATKLPASCNLGFKPEPVDQVFDSNLDRTPEQESGKKTEQISGSYAAANGLHESYDVSDTKTYSHMDYKADVLPPNLFTGASSYQDQEFVRKGQKETFYCEYCLIELNSRDTLYSHTKGQKHLKKVEEHDDRKRRGYYVEDKQVRPIANPLPLQKKVPVRLTEKLRETTNAIVGLDFVHEIIACSNAEVEPYYECELCGQQGEANAMSQHLQGKPHRAKFLQEKFPDNRKYIEVTLSAVFLEREIERLHLRENDDLGKINTIYSDEMFPWTAGKAPWSVEQGGTGNIPTRARNRIGLVSKSIQKEGFGEKREKDRSLKLKDIDPSKLDIQVKTDGDRKRACTIVQKLSQKVRDYSIETGRADPFELEFLFDQVDAIMETVALKDASPEREFKRSRASPTYIKREKSYSPTHGRRRDDDYYRYGPRSRSSRYE